MFSHDYYHCDVELKSQDTLLPLTWINIYSILDIDICTAAQLRHTPHDRFGGPQGSNMPSCSTSTWEVTMVYAQFSAGTLL